MFVLLDDAKRADLLRVLRLAEAELRRDSDRLPVWLAEWRIALLGVTEGQSVSVEPPGTSAGHDRRMLLAMKFERAADQLDVSVPTIKRLVKQGRLPVVYVAGAPRIRTADLEAFMSGLMPGQKGAA